MTDYYKILNVNFEASETEIKKRFRKLATIHHPDKNGGSKKSEETFKLILIAFETLSNRNSRKLYDLKYRQHFHQPKTETTNQDNSDPKKRYEQPEQTSPGNGEFQKADKTKPKLSYRFWVVVVLLALLYFYNVNKKTTSGNTKTDKQFEEQEPQNRPQSGELDFNK